jgi:hypothetical protein
MTFRNDITDIVIDELAEYGLIGRIEHRGKHLAITFGLPSGKMRRLFCSLTPSDWRAPKKQRAVQRRMLRADDMARGKAAR